MEDDYQVSLSQDPQGEQRRRWRAGRGMWGELSCLHVRESNVLMGKADKEDETLDN
jgi:hypothetical protein